MFELLGLRRTSASSLDAGVTLSHSSPTPAIALNVVHVAGATAACYGRIGSIPEFEPHVFAYDGNKLMLVKESLLQLAGAGSANGESVANEFARVLAGAMAEVKNCPCDGLDACGPVGGRRC